MKHLFVRVLFAVAISAAVSSASASILEFHTTLRGSNEIPPNNSPGTGTAVVDYDSIAHTLTLNITFADLFPTTVAGLPSGTTASHIHCCQLIPGVGNAGVATTTPNFVGFPTGVTSGSAQIVLDLTLPSSYNQGAGAFFQQNGGTAASAEAALIAGIVGGRTYLNIHTTRFPGGEIRGELLPEPADLALFVLGLAALGLCSGRLRGTTRRD